MSKQDAEKSKLPCDPGWNDPPTFSYQAVSQVQAASKRTSLTKRVAFPLSSQNSQERQSNQASPQVTGSLPPPVSHLPPTSAPPIIPTTAGSANETSNECPNQNDELKLEEVLNNLNEVLPLLNEDENKAQLRDVEKRLKTMELLWNQGGFPQPLKEGILNMSKALVEGQIQVADDIQRRLMVDFTSHCSSWMTAVRFLINKLKPQTSQDASDS